LASLDPDPDPRTPELGSNPDLDPNTDLSLISVADPGCLSWMPDPDLFNILNPGFRIWDPGSWIQRSKKEGGKFFWSYLYIFSYRKSAVNFTN
jgi:hypothetical protein